EALRECAALAEEEGVRLVLEPLNRYETNLVNTVAEALQLIKEVGSEAMGLLFDTFHANIEEPSIEGSIRAAGSRLLHVHVADSNRWHPGAGHIDFAQIVATLREVGYDGYLSAEILPLPDPHTCARKTIEFLGGLLANIQRQKEAVEAMKGITQKLKEQIERELQAERSFSVDDLIGMIKMGESQEVANKLIYHSRPKDFPSQLEALRKRLGARFPEADEGFRKGCISFLSHLTLGLSSFLVHWNVKNADLHGDEILTDAHIEAEVGANLALLAEWEALAPSVAGELLGAWREEARARFVAEGAEEPEALAEELVGNSVCDYPRNMAEAIEGSNLQKIAEMRIAGLNHTELGNDYAAFLQYAMHLGASFVTCNPVLVDIAWVADPERWNPIADRIVAENPQADESALARLMTLEIVLVNMRLLRPIFLLTNGGMGCVSLQVNPKKHGDAQAMISDATAIYKELRAKLDGGVPNVVFKLPGTRAGLEACYALTGQGIGVNITVNFGLFQQLRFAKAIGEGQAIFAILTEMNGRLAYPVRDELLGKLSELAGHGITEADAREAAAWSGVAVVKRLHKLLQEKGYDLRRIKPLVASLRIYKEGPGYDRLPSPYPDITEDVGTSIITVFPNVRRAFDAETEVSLKPKRIDEPVPERALEVLAHSEIFKQGYYVADQDWVPQEEERFRPDYVLALEDEEAVAAWPPVYNTLTQFSDGYDRFVERLVGRRQLLALRKRAKAGARLSQAEEALVGALANVYDLTVRKALRLVCEVPADAALVPILRRESVKEAIGASNDEEIAALYRLALAKHEPDSAVRRSCKLADS
ncbi:MAG: TIM barrel protein, partial [Candidatus Tectimicrobiota bacterium]